MFFYRLAGLEPVARKRGNVNQGRGPVHRQFRDDLSGGRSVLEPVAGESNGIDKSGDRLLKDRVVIGCDRVETSPSSLNSRIGTERRRDVSSTVENFGGPFEIRGSREGVRILVGILVVEVTTHDRGPLPLWSEISARI